jgi:hypothetical protein
MTNDFYPNPDATWCQPNVWQAPNNYAAVEGAARVDWIFERNPQPMPTTTITAGSGYCASQTTTSVTITWAANPAAQYYYVRRSGGGGPWYVGPGQTSYTDTNLPLNTTYTYTVEAWNTSGEYEPTTASASTQITTPECDTTPPNVTDVSGVNGSFSNACFIPDSRKAATGAVDSRLWSRSQPITVYAQDNQSGMRYVQAQIINNTGTVLGSYNSSETPKGNTSRVAYTISIPESVLNSVTYPTNYYTLRITAFDWRQPTANQSTPVTQEFNTDTTCSCAKLQTQNGDVHSNSNINIPCAQ